MGGGLASGLDGVCCSLFFDHARPFLFVSAAVYKLGSLGQICSPVLLFFFFFKSVIHCSIPLPWTLGWERWLVSSPTRSCTTKLKLYSSKRPVGATVLKWVRCLSWCALINKRNVGTVFILDLDVSYRPFSICWNTLIEFWLRHSTEPCCFQHHSEWLFKDIEIEKQIRLLESG